MSNEQAVELLDKVYRAFIDAYSPYDEDEVKEAFDKAVKALSAQPEIAKDIYVLNNDCIRRQAAIDALDCINGTEEVLRSLPSTKPDNQTNLCDSCDYSYPNCPSKKDDVIFGNGIGNDNICACNKYKPAARPKLKWIPFNTRSLTEEEKEDYPEWECILDCKLPDDGQRILVSIDLNGHEEVQQDEFYSDDGCYLDSNYEIGTEAVAWMPLPEPWRGEEDE